MSRCVLSLTQSCRGDSHISQVRTSVHEVASPENFDLVRSILVEGKLCEKIVGAFEGCVHCVSFCIPLPTGTLPTCMNEHLVTHVDLKMSLAATTLSRTMFFSELAPRDA